MNGFHAHGLARVLEIIREVLPEAFPARYGTYEPLQGKVENGDVGGLLSEFAEDPGLFLKAKTPFSHIFLNVACDAELAKWHPDHRIRREFLVGRMSFELRPKAFDDPRLMDLLREISAALRVFYSEIRDHECPVRAWFWHGLPGGPVRAFCVGKPYLSLWPEAAERGIAIASGVVFNGPARLDPVLPEVPDRLRDPENFRGSGRLRGDQYATDFPFQLPSRA